MAAAHNRTALLAPAAVGGKPDPRHVAAALYTELMRVGMLALTPQGVEEFNAMFARRTLRFTSHGFNTDGEVADVDFDRLGALACRNPQPGYLAICSKVKHQAWAANEWIAYHLLLGVEHIGLMVQKDNTDNLFAVLAAWGDRVSVYMQEGITADGWLPCFEANKDKYAWVAFMDMDEYLNPLKEECLHEVLRDYEQYGGLAVPQGHFNNPAARLFQRRRQTAMEATNFTLGLPIGLPKPICFSAHTSRPIRANPHCCMYSNNTFAVDEVFRRIGSPCHHVDFHRNSTHMDPQRSSTNGTMPLTRHPNQPAPQEWVRIQINHYQQISIESALQKRLRDIAFGYGYSNVTFDASEFLQRKHAQRAALEVVPDATALALLKARSDNVKAVLRW